jgi:hypothetical protein
MLETSHPNKPINTEDQYIAWKQDAPPYRHINYSENELGNFDIPLYAALHDAWRSTRLERNIADPLAEVPFRELPAMNLSLSIGTGMAFIRAVHQHARYHWPERTFDNGFMYDTMEKLYEWYAILLNKDRSWSDESGYFPNGTSPFMAKQYAAKPASYKEVDRRLIVAGMTTLEDPSFRAWDVLQDREGMLQDPAIRHAIRDGQAVLSAVRYGEQYEASTAFGIETIHWQNTECEQD